MPTVEAKLLNGKRSKRFSSSAPCTLLADYDTDVDPSSGEPASLVSRYISDGKLSG